MTAFDAQNGRRRAAGAGYSVEEAGDGRSAGQGQGAGIRPGSHRPQHAQDRRHPRRSIAHIADYDDVAIIVLSTENGVDLKAKGREAGATGWMAKPFDPEKMLAIVRQFID